MSGDNLHGKQPIKFYSEDMTLTKILLIDYHLNINSEIGQTINKDAKILDIENLLSN